MSKNQIAWYCNLNKFIQEIQINQRLKMDFRTVLSLRRGQNLVLTVLKKNHSFKKN